MTENLGLAGMDEVELSEDSKGRQRSTIAFPYSDFDSAENVARAIYENVGHGTCSASSQLAAWMKVSAKSSGFRTQLSSARLFGLVENGKSEAYRLTDLGIRVLDPSQSKSAKAEAFLCVPLFKALYEKYKGVVTPPTAALEAEIVSLGVAEKQKSRARQNFESSAVQTGFREQGANRLVMPAVVVLPPQAANIDKVEKFGVESTADEKKALDLDPLLLALLQKIPKRGESWPAEKRLRWFRTFAMNVSQVYDDDNEPVELRVIVDTQ
jgi:hypothetical protein